MNIILQVFQTGPTQEYEIEKTDGCPEIVQMLMMQTQQHLNGAGDRYGNGRHVPDNTGFSHGAYTSNKAPFQGFNRKNTISSIDTNANIMNGHFSPTGETPGTAFDMNYTPLLPSGLLLGSPFQPGSPGTFGSPQFPTMGRFSPVNNTMQSQNSFQQNRPVMGSPSQSTVHTMSPTLFQNMLAAESFTPQSPNSYNVMPNNSFGQYQPVMPMNHAWMATTSRTVYLGNIPADTSAEEILNHVRSGQIESVRILADKNCAFISFLDASSATHFHSDAILKKLSIKGQDIKVGWGKASQVPTAVALATQQSGASRNVYLGNLPEKITEEELRSDLGKFGQIDTIKMVPEKSIAFVHFLSVANAIKAVTQLPQDSNWQPPRRVFYGKDRCAYVSKTQQQNAAQFLGIAPGYAHVLNGADRDLISNALAQQSVAAAAVATTAGGVNNLGNRTVYLGNIHPETTIEEICNVVRGGLLHHIRYIPDKHICFVTFIDPTSAASFYALSNLQGLMIHNRRLKIGWGKHSGALPPAIALAVSGGASRNVYIGNLDESWTEERLRLDFAEYGEIELVNTLREKSCAFVNFTNIANAIKAIEAVRGREEYKRFKINFGKDRCGNPPRQNINNHQQAPVGEGASPQPMNGMDNALSQAGSSPTRSMVPIGPRANGINQNQNRQNGFAGPTASTILNQGGSNPLTMYLSQVSQQQAQAAQNAHEDDMAFATLQIQQNHALVNQQSNLYGEAVPNAHNGMDHVRSSSHIPRQSSMSGGFGLNGTSQNGASTTIGGLLAPTNTGLGVSRGNHSRTVSLPAFGQDIFGPQPTASALGTGRAFGGHASQASLGGGGFGSAFGTGYGTSGYNGLGLKGDLRGGLSGWAEEAELGAK